MIPQEAFLGSQGPLREERLCAACFSVMLPQDSALMIQTWQLCSSNLAFYTTCYGLGKMQQVWEPWKLFCWEEANPRLCWRRNGDRWEMRRVASATPRFQCSAAEMLGDTQGNISCYGISELHCSFSCYKGSSSNKFVCPGAAALCSLLRVLLRAAWGGTCP